MGEIGGCGAKKEARLPHGAEAGLVIVALSFGRWDSLQQVSAGLDSEAGGGRLRRPAGQSQVKPPRWLEHMSYKDHLLPTKGPGKADLESQNRQIGFAL